jgi:DNA-binding transcriptional MerR regulator
MTMEIRMAERVEDVTPQTDPPHQSADSLAYEPVADRAPERAAEPASAPSEPADPLEQQPTLPGAEEHAPKKPEPKSLTIGAVCKSLEREFPDISISKIRYLEDQKLLSPRRTRGGYRLYSPGDVDRLRTILRLQRDEFLPLRVIRQELAAGRADTGDLGGGGAGRGAGGAGGGSGFTGPDPRALRRASLTVKREGAPLYRFEDVLEETGATAALVKELEEYGVI